MDTQSIEQNKIKELVSFEFTRLFREAGITDANFLGLVSSWANLDDYMFLQMLKSRKIKDSKLVQSS